MVDNIDVPHSGYPYNTHTILLMLIYPILHPYQIKSNDFIQQKLVYSFQFIQSNINIEKHTNKARLEDRECYIYNDNSII